MMRKRSEPKSKIAVLQVEENRDIHFIRNRPISEDRIRVRKNGETPQFSNKDFFTLILPRRFRKPKKVKCVIHRSGSDKCVNLEKNDIIDPLTNEEAKEIVKRNMALGMGKFQPISLRIAIIIILLTLASVIINILQFFRRF